MLLSSYCFSVTTLICVVSTFLLSLLLFVADAENDELPKTDYEMYTDATNSISIKNKEYCPQQ